MTKLTFSLRSAGYCTASKSHALVGASHESIRFYATYGHLVHPEHGHILFDAGYTRRFYSLTQKLPFKIYAKATEVFIQEKEEAVNALGREGIEPQEIKYIIVSHFHADHIGGLKDFPNAQFICSEEAFLDVENVKGFRALVKGFIPDLLPENFKERASLISFNIPDIIHPQLGGLVDVFKDGSILLCELDGHAKGQMGALLSSDKPVFLASDGAWLKANYADLHFPSPIVKLFFNSWKNYKVNLKKIHDFHVENPETLIVPCHCEETYLKHKSD